MDLSFICDYVEDGLGHTYKGSLGRHIIVEKVLFFFQKIMNDIIGDAFPLYDLFEIPISIGLGLNCSFPWKKVIKFQVWMVKGCQNP